MKINKILPLVVAVLGTIAYFFIPIGKINNTVFDVSFVVVVLLCIHFVRASQHSAFSGQWFKPSNVFMVSFLVVSFQFLIDYRLGIKDPEGAYFPQTLNKCLILSVVGLSSFIAGYIQKINTVYYRSSSKAAVLPENTFPISGVLIAIQVICFILFVVSNGLRRLLSGEAYLGGNDLTVGLNTYSEMLLYDVHVVIVLLVATRRTISSFIEYIRSFPPFSLLVLVMYLFLRFVSGDRGPVIYTGFLFFYGYLFASQRKVNLIKTVLFGVVALSLMSILGIVRSLDKEMSFSERFVQGSQLYNEGGRFALYDDYEKTIMPLTIELAGSFKIQEFAVENIEVQHDIYTYGLLQAKQIAGAIPFSSYLFMQLPIRPEYLKSSSRANYLYHGGYERNSGVGTSMVADFYWDFGIIGVLIFMFFAGRIFFMIDDTLIGHRRNYASYYLLLFALVFAAKAVYIPRNTFFTLIKEAVFSIVIFYITTRSLQNKSKKRV